MKSKLVGHYMPVANPLAWVRPLFSGNWRGLREYFLRNWGNSQLVVELGSDQPRCWLLSKDQGIPKNSCGIIIHLHGTDVTPYGRGVCVPALDVVHMRVASYAMYRLEQLQIHEDGTVANCSAIELLVLRYNWRDEVAESIGHLNGRVCVELAAAA